MYRLRNLIALVSLLAFSLSANADLTIRVTKGAENATPIAVVPFADQGNASPPQNISQIVRTDLSMSGDFRTLDPAKMLSLPSKQAEVYYRDWRLLGQQYLVVGTVSQQPDNRYKVQYQLFDVNQQKLLLGKVVEAAANDLRTMAHVISDQIYQQLTGVRGAFNTKLAFVTLDTERGRSVYRLQMSDVDGKRAQILLKSSEPILSPTWSPHARRIAYVSFEGGHPGIYIQNIATGERKRLRSFPGLNSAPAWSPDGKSMLMTLSKDGNAEIYLMNMQSGDLQRLTHHWAIDTEGAWAPDGNRILFTSDRSGGPQIYEMDLRTHDSKRLTFSGRYNARAGFAPDGKSIYYVHEQNGHFRIAAMNLNTGDQRVLTHSDLDESPSVSPNGRMLIYATRQGKKSVLAVISMDGGAKYMLPEEKGDVRDPAWSPYLN